MVTQDIKMKTASYLNKSHLALLVLVLLVFALILWVVEIVMETM